jgi:hypothetical protein
VSHPRPWYKPSLECFAAYEFSRLEYDSGNYRVFSITCAEAATNVSPVTGKPEAGYAPIQVAVNASILCGKTRKSIQRLQKEVKGIGVRQFRRKI